MKNLLFLKIVLAIIVISLFLFVLEQRREKKQIPKSDFSTFVEEHYNRDLAEILASMKHDSLLIDSVSKLRRSE